MNILEEKPSLSSSTQEAVLGKQLYLESYGCQMNEYDSGLVRSILAEQGYSSTKRPENAQLIMLNTCAIRERAQERIYGRLESFIPLKKKRPGLVIGILGCMAQNIGDDLFAMGLPVDFVMGPDNYRQLPELIKRIEKEDDENRSLGWSLAHLSRTEVYDELRPEVVSGVSAFVTIMRGCDNFCSFCVVPYTRGRERSRSAQSIVDEISSLIESHGISEVTLLGQNVNSYRYQADLQIFTFRDLIAKILNETSIKRVRFTSPHPHDFPKNLLSLMSEEERFCSQIHLPLQSGSTSVLERMKRNYTREEYLRVVGDIRSIISDVGLSTDVIVGFCGENQAEFEDTLDMMERVGFDMSYMFHYSERDHTWANKYLKDDVPEKVKLERLNLVIRKQQEISRKINASLVGKTFTVMVEGYSKRSQTELMGRTFSGKVVVFPIAESESCKNKLESLARRLIGQSIPVKIQNSTSATLRGIANLH